MTRAIRGIFLADDHPLSRRGFYLLMQTHFSISVEQVDRLAAIPKDRAVDLIFADWSLYIREKQWQVDPDKVVLIRAPPEVSDEVHPDSVLPSRRIPRDAEVSAALALIGRWLTSEPAGGRREMSGTAREGSIPAELSQQERELLRLVGGGHSNREIATRMGISEGTVKNYLRRLMAKLRVQNRTQVAVIASKWSSNGR